jgi:hypothetical protein
MRHTGLLPFVATLRRLKNPPTSPSAGEPCELCGAPLSSTHRHIVDISTRRVLCACAICSTLEGRYRPVPTRYERLPQPPFSRPAWDALAIPVDLAFFFHNSVLGRIVACYPGPAGATESLLPLDASPALSPWLPGLAADVEALLVRRVGGDYEGFIVPIDACYELVGRIRRTWTGFGGGDAAQEAIELFFASVGDKSAGMAERPNGQTRPRAKERT